MAIGAVVLGVAAGATSGTSGAGAAIARGAAGTLPDNGLAARGVSVTLVGAPTARLPVSAAVAAALVLREGPATVDRVDLVQMRDGPTRLHCTCWRISIHPLVPPRSNSGAGPAGPGTAATFDVSFVDAVTGAVVLQIYGA